jgi:hypothetical protein
LGQLLVSAVASWQFDSDAVACMQWLRLENNSAVEVGFVHQGAGTTSCAGYNGITGWLAGAKGECVGVGVVCCIYGW